MIGTHKFDARRELDDDACCELMGFASLNPPSARRGLGIADP
jgi:hypothetical protein